MGYRNFILSEICKPCLLFCLFQFAQLSLPYQAVSLFAESGDTAQDMLNNMMSGMAKGTGATKELKAHDF